MKNKLAKILIILAILGVVLILWLSYFMYMISPLATDSTVAGVISPSSTFTITAPEPGEHAPFAVEKGAGFKEISDRLENDGLIRSAKFFKMYAILSGKADKLKPGLYAVSPVMSGPEIVRLLAAGPGQEITVLIKEGDNLSQIDEKLAHFGVVEKGSLIRFSLSEKLFESNSTSTVDKISLREKYSFLIHADSLEGFLFPDTYRFFFGSSAEDVVLVLLSNFAIKVGPIIPSEDPIDWNSIPVLRKGIFTIHEIVNIAAMIEREVPDSDDRKMVSDVIYKRLKMNMPLQIDATVLYAKDNGSIYDTYKSYGLPPGPIANPGLDAIEAALNPKPGPYLYYLSDPETGDTIFARDFEEHKANQGVYFK